MTYFFFLLLKIKFISLPKLRESNKTQRLNQILAKAYDAGLYGEWYAEAEELAGIDTAADVSYDEDGNVAQ